MKADLILESNLIFNSIENEPFSGFIAIKDNKIIKISKNSSEKELYIEENTEIQSFKDKLIMPAFGDSHTHLFLGGMFEAFVNLGDCKSEEECAEYFYKNTKQEDKTKWCVGYNWYNFNWNDKSLPSKKSLDKYFKDTPVLLLNAEAHNAWINTKALEICGITKDTKDPFGGKIERDEQGEPTGFLFENGISLITPYAFNFTIEQEKEFFKAFEKTALKNGITSIIDVKPYFGCDLGSLEVLKILENEDDLNLRVHCASDLFGNQELAFENSKKYFSDKIRANFLKQFVDGVIPTHTALLLENYSDPPYDKGSTLNELDLFGKAINNAQKLGLSVKIHAIGDRAIRFTLDCYENALKTYGKTSSRHAVEHCELVAKEDFERFGTLNIIPSVQPEHLGFVPSWEEEPYRYVLGEERANTTWSFKNLLTSAGVIALGSDYPVITINPFLGISRGLSRLHDDLLPEGGWNPTQKLTLEELLKGYTLGSAYAMGREEEIGTLEEGKFADIIIINENLFELSPEKIRKATIHKTIMDGKIVYEE